MIKEGNTMKLAIGSDHAGFELKEQAKEYLKSKGYELIDYGTNSKESVDYPDYAKPVSYAVKNNEVEYGILICYTGIGMSMSSNKVKGIRAALVTNVENARLTREHNNANVLCIGAKDVSFELLKEILDTFLNTKFLGDRHLRRVNKVMALENE